MHARHITVHVKPGQLDEAIATYRTGLSKASEEAREGHHVTYMMVDREKNEMVVVALWEREEGAQAAAASQWNQELAKTMAGFFTGTPERRIYEVVLGAPPT